MQKNIMIISIALIGLVLVFSGNTWAAGNKGGSYQKWDKPSNLNIRQDHGRSLRPGIRHDPPEHRYIPRFNRPDPYRAPYRLAPKYRPWRQQPFFRPFHPGRNYWRHHRGAANKKFYRSSGSYVPQDEFSASAFISDTGFAVSVGVRDMN
jgi:hypothetical protein